MWSAELQKSASLICFDVYNVPERIVSGSLRTDHCSAHKGASVVRKQFMLQLPDWNCDCSSDELIGGMKHSSLNPN